jgi:prohibitin 2
MSPQAVARLIGVALLIFAGIIMASSGTYVIEPGFRGVEVVLGKVSPDPKPEGFGFRAPLITAIHPVSIRQQTAQDKAECYSADLQQIGFELRVLFRIPEGSVVKLYQGFYGDPFETLIAPRIHEALKEVAAEQSAERIVTAREQIKTRALELARAKIGALLVIEDIVIQNIGLTRELEQAIEAKMVQEQEAQRSKFVQQRAQIEADTAVIKAKGEAESIRLRGEALKENPAFVDLQIVDKWDGFTPLVIGGPGGSGVLMTVQELEQRRRQNETTPAPAPSGLQRQGR